MLKYTMNDERMDEIFKHFKSLFGSEPKCELNYTTGIDLLVAIILSAQCTDVRVNKVTETLFQKYKTIQDYANADVAVFEQEIYSTGFYRNKAANIIALCKKLVTEHDGVIPSDVDALATLPGIGRKTASVFVAEFHKLPAIAVDTHVIRIANRLGMTTSKNPTIIERDLAKLWKRDDWAHWHLYMVLFGRYHCTSRNPKCEGCGVREWCKLH